MSATKKKLLFVLGLHVLVLSLSAVLLLLTVHGDFMNPIAEAMLRFFAKRWPLAMACASFPLWMGIALGLRARSQVLRRRAAEASASPTGRASEGDANAAQSPNTVA